MRDQLSGLVFSTEKGQMCPGCQQALDECACDALAEEQRLEQLDGIVRIRRETAGRKGKGVTTVTGVPLAEKPLKQLAKKLKQQCGTGGSVKEGVIEIQGDHRGTLKLALEKQGYTVKLAGG
ncbi:translation initiation factor Sui1 [Aliamphritea spongicola]|uniref:translation initiation factor Sui1 n=1 Tax=Aliamphritea spongicola TaxID=707589 RepID=UPI00196B11F1|nr:translation initiation factor Sui1 [Aliamphritea spongicola]MBN3564783.1 translation initiation factor Sui1 [Aliamphritea spongicola]